MLALRSRRRPLPLLVAIGLLAVAVAPMPATAVVTPIVQMTLTASPNPAASGEELTYTITISPTNGTVPAITVELDGKVVATACSPAPNCSIAGNGIPSWSFTNVSAPVTGTATSTAGIGGDDVRLYIASNGAGCAGACPAAVHTVVPIAHTRVTYTGPSPVVNGSQLHFAVRTSINAGPAEALVQVEVPAGFGTPTNIVPGTATWDPTYRVIASLQTLDTVSTLTFDSTVTGANGTTPVLAATVFPSTSNYRAFRDSVSIAVGSQVPPPLIPERQSGADRFATAVAISRGTYGGDTFVAFIATGRNYPDALVAGPAAFERGGPVLLVEPTSIPQVVKNELTRLHPARIYVLGGTAAISESVRTQLAAYSSNPVIRLSGSNRYQTGANVVTTTFGGYTGPVFLATGTNYPDALSGGPAAAQRVAPIVLTTRDSLPTDSQLALQGMTPTKFILLGGSGVLSSALVGQLTSLYGVPVERWSGVDRYATSAAISAHAFAGGAEVAYLAIGTNYPDALAGGPSAAAGPGPILLSKFDCLPPAVYAELQRLDPARVVLLGGPGVLSTAAATTECAG